jgi:hypothetical protein
VIIKPSGLSDFLRRRALAAESVTPVKGVMTFGPTKGHERRDVPLPRFLLEDLAQHIPGKAPDDLVFAGVRGGAALRYPVFQRGALNQACARIGIPRLTPHELRHTAASLAIAAGADIKVVQQMLGPQVGDDDARPVRAPFRRSARRCRRRNGRRAGESALGRAPDRHQTGTRRGCRVADMAVTRRNTCAPGEIRTRAPASGEPTDDDLA